MQTFNVCESFLGGSDEPRAAFPHSSLVIVLLVKALVVTRVPATRLCRQDRPVSATATRLHTAGHTTIDLVELET